MKSRSRKGVNGHGSNGVNRLTLVTGGAGFIGSNLADALLQRGEPVLILDNLSRPGVERNVQWLRSRHGDRLRLWVADVRDAPTVHNAVRQASRIFHFAAQVAVTTSCQDPVTDFEVNARGTLNVLEAMRALPEPPPLVFTSTNKVYGALDDVPLRATDTRYEPAVEQIRRCGIDEHRCLSFHSPYGCSKGVADQYVLDYARCFGLDTVVFRMSCIYGGRQFGCEEQGWVAHLLQQATAGNGLTIYGDGKQVRDILHIEDLVRALVLASDRIASVRGEAFNIGGGADHAISLLELIDHIERMRGLRPEVAFADWRPGDQRYYVSDTAKFQAATGWKPTVSIPQGLERLQAWVRELANETSGGRAVHQESTTPSRGAHQEPRIG